ncbi:HlyD family type I secretion periplasmic adaptor subunit [Rhizobium sp. DKSPLA3]|uniref:Membrane fusion protein (MFP) family protein n=1 Tax=Rhizobium quercicola TaxID=2901226 RepID=A0A9X1NP87_9HYPH|nr:HlyD family type I secretion periplasmic adaptor subunit [Rhizobium quercicola]
MPDDMQGRWADGVKTETRDILSLSSRGLLAGAGLFLLWSLLFPISSAVVAEGVLVSSGRNKVLQHRTGGVVTDIAARDGEVVQAGAPVLRLDPVNNQADLIRFKARFAVLDAMRRRLEAENAVAANAGRAPTDDFGLMEMRQGFDTTPAPLDSLQTGATGAGDPLVAEQQRQFARGRGAADAEIEAMLARKDALIRRREGVRERLGVMETQVASLKRQAGALQPAVDRGHIARKVLWDAEDQLLARTSDLSNLKAENDALEDDAGEIDSRIRQARLTDQRETSMKLTEVLAEMRQISGQMQAAEAAVSSADLRAPVTGTVVHSKHTTIGAVIAPGEVLAEIVPSGSDFAVKARIAPHDITHVRTGQTARVKIAALNARIFDDIDARVTRVAADSTADEKTGQHYFEVDLLLTQAAPAEQALLGPGMTAQVYIEGESRTFADYVLAPFTDSLSRSFREP